MTDITERLAQIKELADRATAGPWATMPPPSREAVVFTPKQGDTPGNIIAASPGWADEEGITLDEELDNCYFIAQARELVPRLVAALEQQMEVANALQCAAASHGLANEEWFSAKTAELAKLLGGQE